MQSSESRLVSRQSTVNQLQDILSQFAKLSDEADVTDSEHEVVRAGDQLNELNDRLSARRAVVNVRVCNNDDDNLRFCCCQGSHASWKVLDFFL